MQQYHPFLKKKQVDYNVPIDDNMQFHLSIYIDYILQVSQDSITFPAWINTKSIAFFSRLYRLSRKVWVADQLSVG